ncbi:unnamed protein product [Alopecurus aequalis]
MASPFMYILLVCHFCSIGFAVGGHTNFATASVTILETEDVCSVSAVRPGTNGAATAPLMHRYGPCAPSQSTDKPSTTEMLQRSRARAKHIIRGASRGKARIPTYLGSSVDSLDYMVTVALGTPAVPQTVLVDTGSDMTWVQCGPCNSPSCYRQKDPMFNPSKSSTYAPIPCGSDACKVLYNDVYELGACTNDTDMCRYEVVYGDGSNTTGVYGNEVLTLAPGVVVKSFHFGCGNHQRGDFDAYDGILGLGGAFESLGTQTSWSGFSYCLPPVNSRAGFLALDVRRDNTSGFSFTPMVREDFQSWFYQVTLTGISVGGKPLNISYFSNGILMMIDSGTIQTALPPTAYKAVRSAFRAAMAAYPLVPNGALDTCYNFTGHGNVTVPRVALTFSGGATIDLDVPNGVLLDGCLAFNDTGEDGPWGVLGNVNQRTLEVMYDVAGGQVGFRAGAC